MLVKIRRFKYVRCIFCILALQLGEPRWRLRSWSGKRVKLAAVKTGAWPRLVEGLLLSGRRRRACGWLSREQRSWQSPELGDRVWWKINKNKNRRSWGRQIDRRLRKKTIMGLLVWTEMLRLWCNGKWCHRMLLNRQLDGGKTAVFMSKGWLPRLCTTCAN